jgi:DeoR family fructose operon transcriptional repressor
MLNEDRYAKIIDILGRKQSASVTELSQVIGISESTIRRDLNYLHDKNKLKKIFGGAVLREELFTKFEEEIQIRKTKNQAAKRQIAEFAASLICDGDCVYLDAGSTLDSMADYIKATDALFVTNSPGRNYQFVRRGLHSLLTGGELQISSDILLGLEPLSYLQKFNFSKGFFGVDAVSLEGGFSTFLSDTGFLKLSFIKHCQNAYVIADSSKFDTLAPMKFAGIADAAIITERLINPRYREFTQVYEAGLLPGKGTDNGID